MSSAAERANYFTPKKQQALAQVYRKANPRQYRQIIDGMRATKAAGRPTAPAFAKMVLALSEQRYIYPDELPVLCREMLGGVGWEILYENSFAGCWLPKEARTYGLFLRVPPFAYVDPAHQGLPKTFLSQLKMIPESMRGIRAEVLILTLVSKGN